MIMKPISTLPLPHPCFISLQDRNTWKNGLWAMQDVLVLERFVNNELLNIHRDADTDPHVSHLYCGIHWRVNTALSLINFMKPNCWHFNIY